MKTNLFSFAILALISLGVLLSFSYPPTEEQKDTKFFTLRIGDTPMSEEVKAKLISAYKAQYGTKAVVKSVTLEDFKGETWLVFTSGGKDNPSVAYQTRKKKDPISTGVPSDAPKETCTGVGCSVCKFGASGGCYCDNRGGDGRCDHTISRISEDANFVNALFN